MFASLEVKKTTRENDLSKRRMLIHSGKLPGSLFKPIFQLNSLLFKTVCEEM